MWTICGQSGSLRHQLRPLLFTSKDKLRPGHHPFRRRLILASSPVQNHSPPSHLTHSKLVVTPLPATLLLQLQEPPRAGSSSGERSGEQWHRCPWPRCRRLPPRQRRGRGPA